jgi:hypothetical protein
MNTQAADRMGDAVTASLERGQTRAALALLAPVLSSKTAFRLLDRIGMRIGAGPLPETNEFLARLADGKTMGAWPLIGSALAAQLGRDFAGALDRCREFIRGAGVWYAADTLAERVPGQALVDDFGRALAMLSPWRSDPDRWVRKSAGVAIHLWTKRSHGDARLLPRVKRLLAFLEPMFSEQDMDAAKGAGWALKTLGRYYPEAVAPWLERMVAGGRGTARKAGYARLAGYPRLAGFRAVTLRKALTYLPAAHRRRVLRAAGQ